MITQQDKDFARAMVDLARSHGVGTLSVNFSLRSAKNFQIATFSQFADVSMRWAEGRHGAGTQIHLEAKSVENISEKDAP